MQPGEPFVNRVEPGAELCCHLLACLLVKVAPFEKVTRLGRQILEAVA